MEETNPIARNYYLSEAFELSNKIIPNLEYVVSAEQAKNIPLQSFFDAMGPRLNPEKAKDKLIKIGFNIVDTNETFSVVIRNQIAEVSHNYDKSYDAIITIDSMTWKGIMLKTENPAKAFASGKLKVEGSYTKFLQFSSLFSNN